ncbi:MAG: lipoate-protein ligase A [Akkermansiaceae bacterium]|jgi:lipoate-protein ligase A
MLFEELKIWHDGMSKSGPENMAVDEWLVDSIEEIPILRIYSWDGAWASLGYFQSLAEAREIFGDGPEYVRRWTGGGIVDHRNDVTYTLVVPRSHELAGKRGDESYCAIHGEIAHCLGEGGIACDLTPSDSANRSSACFEKPVAWDLLGEDGRKLAGAGQRRSRRGLMHQGSVIAEAGALDRLGEFLGGSCSDFGLEGETPWADLVGKYASRVWLERVS